MKYIPVYFLFLFWLNMTAALIVQPSSLLPLDPFIHYDESTGVFDEWIVFSGCCKLSGIQIYIPVKGVLF